jgi:hypothetical protein
MNKITQPVIESLSQDTEGPVVSIYLPTHRYPTPPHMQEDETRFKNLLHEARDKWKDKVQTNDMDRTFQQLEEKLDDPTFWHEATEGMAIFATPDRYDLYHLPMESEEHVCVSEAFDITPLLILQEYDQPYYLLTLAMHNTKLFKGDMYGLESVNLEFPASPEDALNIDEMFTNSNTIRNQDAAGMASPHGQGDSNQAGTEERLQYFRILDAIIADSPLVDNTLPVLVAATDSEAGDYRRLSKLNGLIQPYLKGNHTGDSPQVLHALAWPLIQQEIVHQRTQAMIERYNELQGIDKSSNDIEAIGVAADSGRIATLVVGMIRYTTDTVRDKVDSAVPVITFVKHQSAELLEQLARKVRAKGGKIVGVNYSLTPEKVPVAAIYRY